MGVAESDMTEQLSLSQLVHVVQQKQTQHCKAIILQLRKKMQLLEAVWYRDTEYNIPTGLGARISPSFSLSQLMFVMMTQSPLERLK